MKIKHIAAASGAALIAGVVLAPPAHARDVTVIEGPSEPEACTTEVAYPVFAEQEFVQTAPGSPARYDAAYDYSETRATGHFQPNTDGSLHIWTEGATSTDKVALYHSVSIPLASVSSVALNYTATFGVPASSQLVVDITGDGVGDGILVGEPVYGDNLWLSNSATDAFKNGAPHTGGGYGSAWYGTLAEWAAQFGSATIVGAGFSLGSGVHGDGTVHSLQVGAESLTFTTLVPAVAPTFEWIATGETRIDPPADTETVRWVLTEETETVTEEGLCYEQIVATDWTIDFGGNCDQPVDIYTRTLTGERWFEREGLDPVLLASWDEGIDTKETYWTEYQWNVTCGIPVEQGPQAPVFEDNCGTENDVWYAPEPRNADDVWLYTAHYDEVGDTGTVQAFLPEGYYIAGDGLLSGTRYWYPVWEFHNNFTDEPCVDEPTPTPSDGGTTTTGGTGTPSDGGVFGLASTGGQTMPVWVPLTAGFLILGGGIAWFVTRPRSLDQAHED